MNVRDLQIPKPDTDPGFVERCRQAIPLGRTGTPRDLKRQPQHGRLPT